MHEPISYYMTQSPHTIGKQQTLDVATQMMEEFGIRHLPVLHGGRLVGLLSHRDIEVVHALINEKPELITVEEAMTPEVYTIEPDVSSAKVFRHMADHKYGSAIIADAGRVQGVFTVTDALEILADMFDESEE